MELDSSEVTSACKGVQGCVRFLIRDNTLTNNLTTLPDCNGKKSGSQCIGILLHIEKKYLRRLLRNTRFCFGSSLYPVKQPSIILVNILPRARNVLGSYDGLTFTIRYIDL